MSCGADIAKTGWVKLDEEWRNLKPIEFAMIRQSKSSEEQFWKNIVKSLAGLYLQQEQEKMEKKDISGKLFTKIKLFLIIRNYFENKKAKVC